MVHSISRWFVSAAWLAAALTAQAQPAAGPARPDPLDPKASVPRLAYHSSFAQYRKLGDDKPADPSKAWREANDSVNRIGGWRVYAREAQQPDPAPSAPSAGAASAAKPAVSASAPMPDEKAKPMSPGHGGHKTP